MKFDQNGALASQHLKQLIDESVIKLEQDVDSDQIQPASIDLRLGSVAYRVRSSFLPGKDRKVSDCLDHMVMHRIDLNDGAVLEKSCVYIVPLQESLNLPNHLAAAGNPKSSTGRLDVFTRLITDHGTEFEQVPAGYSGPLYAEIAPLTFSVLVRRGSRLSQLRVRSGQSSISDEAHYDLQNQQRLRAKRHSGVVDVDKSAAQPVSSFWEPLYAQSKQLILDPGEFYILVSKEAVHVPAGFAAEMVPYDTLVGEFRVHYAGFFDPGFGAPEAGGYGARAVLEVRSFDVPFLLEDGQNVGRLVYETMLEIPDRLYGQGVPSNYQAQGLKLSKHFRMGSD